MPNSKHCLPQSYSPWSDNQAYQLEVTDTSMAPRYRPGDLVIVTPNVEPESGCDAVIFFLSHGPLLVELIDTTRWTITCRLTSSEARLKFSRTEIGKIHLVVAAVRDKLKPRRDGQPREAIAA